VLDSIQALIPDLERLCEDLHEAMITAARCWLAPTE